MTTQEIRWLHRLESRIETHGLDYGFSMLIRMGRSNRWMRTHQRLVFAVQTRFLFLAAMEGKSDEEVWMHYLTRAGRFRVQHTPVDTSGNSG